MTMWNDKGVCTYPRCSCKATGNYCSKRSSSKEKKRKPIAKRSEKGILKAAEKKVMVDNDMLLYWEIWEERPHVCFECDQPITGPPLLQYFHHLLAKGLDRFKHLRHEKRNICILCTSCHNKVTDSLQALPKTYVLYIETLKYYGFTS